MNAFLPEPPHSHGGPARTAVLLVNLGTPEAPTAAAVRRYLAQFLSDRRVVEIPPLLWWPILHGIVLRTRPAKSARKYAAIWTPDGSPLKLHTEHQARALSGSLHAAGLGEVQVAWAMRYGQPSIPAVLESLRASGCTRILVLPLYPQYAASTTASTLDEVARGMLVWRNLPEMRFVRNFHDHPGYIQALAVSVREHWQVRGRPDRLVMSFHGLPRRSLDLGDPYFCECQKTGRLLAEELGLRESEALVTFQSRFGRARWLEPYTQPTLEQLARQGVGRVDVMCPGFVSDCLETLEEIALENRATFLAAGGKEFHYIPCLNGRPEWIAALADLVGKHLSGWPCGETADKAAAERSLRMGAAG
ncbi:MAG: ferrochelatase [Rhodocyclaceae bacterium]|nr:ferrochelatase [Rhodocyclaceae bacterium]